jgi:aryl carrier-like protein
VSTTAVPHEELIGQVRQVWADVLGVDTVEEVPLEVNFLEAGGNSLLLVMLWEQLQPLAGRPVKLSELFQHGTVRAQVDLLGTVPEAAPAPAPAGAGTPGRSLLAQRRAAGTGSTV